MWSQLVSDEEVPADEESEAKEEYQDSLELAYKEAEWKK